MYVAKNAGSWEQITTSTDWETTATSPDYANGDPTTQQVSAPDGFRVGLMAESTHAPGPLGVNGSNFEETTEFEFLINPETTLTATDFYDFRINFGFAELATYTETPRLTIASSGAGSSSPDVIARSFTVDDATVEGVGVISPAVTARVFTVDAPTLAGKAEVSPAVTARSFTVDAPTLVGQAVQTAPLIARLFTVDGVTLAGLGEVSPAATVRSFTVDDATPFWLC